MRRRGIFCGMALLAACCLAGILPVHFSVDGSGCRHWRVAQTKSVAGTPMTIDDIWWTRTADGRQTFLRILCHWNNGFPPTACHLRASLLSPSGQTEVKGMLTWYVPLPKSPYAPPGMTPFLWEFRTAPPTGRDVRFRVHYASSHLVQDNGTVASAGPVGSVDFEVPNVAAEQDMSCPDIFAPKPFFTANFPGAQMRTF